MEIPSLSFVYLNPAYIKYACKQYAGVPLDILKNTLENLAMISVEKNNAEGVALGQILYSDIYLINNPMVRDVILADYKDAINEHGKTFADIVVTQDYDRIKQSIYDVIVFAMDKVYKTNILHISFIVPSKMDTFRSDYPNFIYEVIQQHFNIKEQVEHYGGREITITKKE